MPVPPIVVAAGISAGASFLGSLFNKRPDSPDLVTPTQAVLSKQRTDLERALDLRVDMLQNDLAAQGAFGTQASAARDIVFKTNAGQSEAFDAYAIDAINEAMREQALIDYDSDLQAFGNRNRSLQNVTSGIGQYLALKGVNNGGGSDFIPGMGEGSAFDAIYGPQ